MKAMTCQALFPSQLQHPGRDTVTKGPVVLDKEHRRLMDCEQRLNLHPQEDINGSGL